MRRLEAERQDLAAAVALLTAHFDACLPVSVQDVRLVHDAGTFLWRFPFSLSAVSSSHDEEL